MTDSSAEVAGVHPDPQLIVRTTEGEQTMGWFDSGHSDPAPRGEMIPIHEHRIAKVFQEFGVTRILAPRPIGKITTDPHGRR